MENDAKLADARVDALAASFDQLKNQAASTNEQDVQLRALERDAKSQRDLLESYLAKYREATARDTINSAPADARVISRATVSNVPAYPKKLPTVLIASLATLVLCSGLVLTRELLAAPPITGRLGAVTGSAAGGRAKAGRGPLAGSADCSAAPNCPVSVRRRRGDRRAGGEPAPAASTLAARIASLAKKPQPVGVPVSAIETFAHHRHQEGFESSQFALFGAAPAADTSRIAIKFARALAGRGARGAGRARLGTTPRSGRFPASPAPPALPNLPPAPRRSAASSPGQGLRPQSHHLRPPRRRPPRVGVIAGHGHNLRRAGRSYDHVVVDAGALDGAELAAIAEIAPHAVLIVETLAGPATATARERLIDAGFDDVTMLVGGRTEPAASAAPEVASPVAA